MLLGRALGCAIWMLMMVLRVFGTTVVMTPLFESITVADLCCTVVSRFGIPVTADIDLAPIVRVGPGPTAARFRLPAPAPPGLMRR